MPAPLDPNTAAKRQILVGLSRALAALSERMRSQQDAAVKITLLAVRAEAIAERSWELSHAGGEHFRRDSDALARDIRTFAADVVSAAKRAGDEAMLGREVGRAIAAHSRDIAELAGDIDILPDAAAVRARLRPLSETLAILPERLKANAETIRSVNALSTFASGLAERSAVLGKGGLAATREAVALSRDLRHFAEDATSISLEMTRGAAVAVNAIDDLAAKTVGLSLGQPVSDKPMAADARLAALVRDAPRIDEVWVKSAAKRDAARIPGSTVWGSAAGKT
nr:hypothetical protein [uncultured Rhodopila sp.]